MHSLEVQRYLDILAGGEGLGLASLSHSQDQRGEGHGLSIRLLLQEEFAASAEFFP